MKCPLFRNAAADFGMFSVAMRALVVLALSLSSIVFAQGPAVRATGLTQFLREVSPREVGPTAKGGRTSRCSLLSAKYISPLCPVGSIVQSAPDSAAGGPVEDGTARRVLVPREPAGRVAARVDRRMRVLSAP